MEFWEDLSRKISGAADYTVKETEKLTATAKLRYRISGEKNRLELLYQGVGKLRYGEAVLGKEVSPELYEGLFGQITEKAALVSELEERLAELQNYRICPECGMKIGRNMKFCHNCGKKQQQEKDTEETAGEEENGSENAPGGGEED